MHMMFATILANIYDAQSNLWNLDFSGRKFILTDNNYSFVDNVEVNNKKSNKNIINVRQMKN